MDDSQQDRMDDREEQSLVDQLRRVFQDESSSSHIFLRMPAGAVATELDASQQAAEPHAALAAGSRLGDFEIVEELGRGGMGIVYRAWQSTLNREVALKVLPASRQRSSSGARRFRTEARAAARLHHENLVPVYAQGECDGQLFFSMELVDGISLDAAIRSRPELLSSTFHWDHSGLSKHWTTDGSGSSSDETPDQSEETSPEPDAIHLHWSRDDFRHLARLAAGAADGLAHAHERGVVHRDIKPHNILLGSDGRLHITDFGLAYLTNEPHVTVSGEIIGTPAYLSPEQVRGGIGAIDHRTDIYSFGVTMYELLTRQRPFYGETRDQLFHSICRDEPRPPRKVDSSIPVDLDTICLRAIEKQPARRYPSAAMLAEDLRRFADGRPILSRRTGPLEKGLKWVLRHRAFTTAIATTVGIVVLGVGLAASQAARRRNQAAAYLDHAYIKLARYNYSNPEVVADAIARAEELGAEPVKLGLTKTLADLGAQQWEEALAEARQVLDHDPENDQAEYLIAWAHAESGNSAAARAMVEEADRLGGPQSAEAWFFRGFAVHNNDPTDAIRSYREAIRLRAEHEDLYLQANLHLARAYNQRLYVERNLEDFSRVKSKLEELIDNNYRGAYPYYLLSIGHRFAGEVYAGTGGSGERNAEEHFQESLRMARAGQEVDPSKNRPVTAEAECLESMGRFDDSIEARTRALDLAELDSHRCEQYHYRWRLYYWTGDFEAALGDLASHLDCEPDSIYYQHLYPSLVFADMGDLDRALDEVRAVADESPEDAQAVLATASWLRILGQPDEADALLASSEGQVRYDTSLQPPQTAEWVEALFRFCAGIDSLESLLDIASVSDTPWKLEAELYFHAAARALGEGNRRSAMGDLKSSYKSFDSQQRYTFHSKLIFERMLGDPSWPLWLTANTASSNGDDRDE